MAPHLRTSVDTTIHTEPVYPVMSYFPLIKHILGSGSGLRGEERSEGQGGMGPAAWLGRKRVMVTVLITDMIP